MTSNASSNLQPGARQYLEATASHLADLDVAERGELVSDIADALAEQPADSSFEDLVVGLGAPSLFARELRESAGVAPAPVAPARGTASADATSVGDASAPADVVAPEDATVVVAPSPATGPMPGSSMPAGDSIAARSSRGLVWAGRELEPLWWILRGIAVAALVFVASQAIGFNFGYSSREVLVVMGLVAVGVSTVSGVRTRLREGDARPDTSDSVLRRRGVGIVAVGVVTVVAMSNLMSTTNDTGYPYPFEEAGAGVDGLYLDGSQVNNVYAFDADGRRIERVRLFTDAGVPLDVGYVGVEDPQREAFADSTSGELRNVFPIRYRDEATGRVEEPDAGWPSAPGTLRGVTVEATTVAPADGAEATEAVEAEPAADTATAAADPVKPAASEAATSAKPVVRAARIAAQPVTPAAPAAR